MSFRVRKFDGYDDLDPSYSHLLEEASRRGIFFEREWTEMLMFHSYEEDNQFCLYAVESASSGRPLLLVPLRFTQVDGSAPNARTIASVGHGENFEGAAFLFDPETTEERSSILIALFAHLKEGAKGDAAAPEFGPVDMLRLWPFPDGSELLADVQHAMNASGYYHQIYEHSYNRHEDTRDISFDEYFSRRSAKHRHNCRRHERALERAGKLDWEILENDHDEEKVTRCIDDYVLVSVASWKAPNSTVASAILDLLRLAAMKDCLRLGVLRLDGRAIAAQFWLIADGRAKSIRMSYDESARDLAPGVVLSMRMIRHLIEVDKVTEIDFCLGEERYKSSWMRSERNYWGVLGFNSQTLRGKLYGARHVLGRAVWRKLTNRHNPRERNAIARK